MIINIGVCFALGQSGTLYFAFVCLDKTLNFDIMTVDAKPDAFF